MTDFLKDIIKETGNEYASIVAYGSTGDGLYLKGFYHNRFSNTNYATRRSYNKTSDNYWNNYFKDRLRMYSGHYGPYYYRARARTYYGYNYPANKYNVVPLNKDHTVREVPGGGSSGSPTAFGSFSSIKLIVAEADTSASRTFGQGTHTWVHLVMGG